MRPDTRTPAGRRANSQTPRRRRAHAAPAGVMLAWATAVLIAALSPPAHFVLRAAIATHLLCFAVGFGAVLLVNGYALAYLIHRTTLPRLLSVLRTAHRPIWAAWAGLLASGTLAQPHLSAPLTQVKLAAVLAIGLGGLRVARVRRELGALTIPDVPRPMRRRALYTGLVSQLSWWTAVLIGWHNSTL